jgi:hypothetical protein
MKLLACSRYRIKTIFVIDVIFRAEYNYCPEDGGSMPFRNVGENENDTRCHSPEDNYLYSHCCENLKFCFSCHLFSESPFNLLALDLKKCEHYVTKHVQFI